MTQNQHVSLMLKWWKHVFKVQDFRVLDLACSTLLDVTQVYISFLLPFYTPNDGWGWQYW